MDRLRDVTIRQAKPGAKPVRLFDGAGLYLEVSPKGGRWWRLKYRVGGREKRISLGTYPAVSLKAARAERDRLRDKLRTDGADPSASRRAARVAATEAKAEATRQAETAAATFETIARDWYAKRSPTWAKSYGPRLLRGLERDVFPYIGARPITEIETPEILDCLRRIEERDVKETARRLLATSRAVFQYAIAIGRAVRDPSPDPRHVLTRKQTRHLAAVTDPSRVGEILRTLRRHRGTFVVSCALRLAPLVFVRPGELRQAEWSGIDLDAAEWRFTLSKTKGEHLVPLARQAVAILRELHQLTGKGHFVFPSERTSKRPMSENAVLYAMRDLGIPQGEMTGHGFRAMARTMLDEQLGVRVDLIEHQLGHAVRDPLGRAYNRTSFLPERREMMQRWADYLEQLEHSAS